MKKIVTMILMVALMACCMSCQPHQDGTTDDSLEPTYLLDVRFTATVDSVIEDRNTEEGTPRDVVLRTSSDRNILFGSSYLSL